MIVLAADFGGTTIKLGVVSEGKLLAADRIPAQAERPMPERLEAIAIRWETMLAEVGLKCTACAAAAFALPFLADPAKARVLGDFGKFPGAAQVDFAAWAQARLGLPVTLENDLRVALLGEAAAGAAREHQDVVMIALGTGIGCAVLSDGRLFRGVRNRAAALMGHCSLNFDAPSGRCGNPGCAEDLASTATLAELAQRRPNFSGSLLSRAAVVDYEAVFRCADEGDPCSRSLVEHSLRVWATVVLTSVIAYDPAIVVLGGGVMRRHHAILPAIRTHLAGHLPGLRTEIPVVASALGDDAALLGCERLVTEHLFRTV
ncbi:MAG: ROK family protein [Verrucomicrobiota bacterium]